MNATEKIAELDRLINERLALHTRMQITVRKLRIGIDQHERKLHRFHPDVIRWRRELRDAELRLEQHLIECSKLVAGRDRWVSEIENGGDHGEG